MSDQGSPERGAARPTGRFGRPTRQGTRMMLIAAAGLGIAVYAVSGSNEPRTMRSAPAAGGDTIGATAQMNLTMPPAAQPVVMTNAANQALPPGVGPVMPQGNPFAQAGAQAMKEKPRRVTSFSATRKPDQAGGGTGGGQGAPNGAGQRQEATTVAFPAATMPGLRAGAAIDTTLVVVPGIYAMTLLTPVNSEREGSFLAVLPRDIKSPAGVVLMEKGTTIRGNYKSDVASGQERIVTAAAWAITPNGVPVPLGDSSVTDGTGRVGMPGTLNTHWGARLGGALVLMVTQGAFQAATATLQASAAKGGGNTFFNLNSSGVDRAIADAVRSGAAIQNTVDVEAGKEIAFMLTQPISFADSYHLAPTGAR